MYLAKGSLEMGNSHSFSSDFMNKAFRFVDDHQFEMLEELKKLCGFRSVAGDDEGLDKTRDFIQRKMEAVGLHVSKHLVKGGNALIAAEYPGEAPDTILFYNHYDVVEEGKYENWRTKDPFDARIIDGKIYARGISDNKGGLLSRVHAIEAILSVYGKLPAGVKFLVEGDEESSSPSMSSFAKTYKEVFRSMTKADVCVWENGRKDESGHPWARFGVRGSCAFDVCVRTAKTDTHSRMGATIPSASWRLVWALASLKDVDEKILIDGFYDQVIEASSSDLQVLDEFPYEEQSQKEKLGIKNYLLNATGIELKRRVYLEPSLSICGLESGEVHNGVRGIVPSKAYARISFYLVADQDPSTIGELLRKHFDRHGFSDIEVTQVGGSNSPVRTPIDIPFRSRLREAAEKVYEMPLVTELTQLGSGPAIVIRDAWPQMPIIGFGPGNTNGNHHAPDENLNVVDYFQAIKYVIALFFSYMG